MRTASNLERTQALSVAVSLLFVVYLLVPILATLLYAFAGKWDRSVLPRELTLKWFADLFSDGRFYRAMGRSMLLCGGSTIFGVALMLPSVYAILLWRPKWERALALLTVLPYGMPGVVSAVGLIRVYSRPPLAIAGTPWIVLGAYLIGVLPYLYQSLVNAFRSINARSLTEAAYLLGADPWKAFLRVIVPGMASGVVSAAILSFSLLFGEFVLANLLIGGTFETLQMYLYRRLAENGHIASAVVVVFVAMIGAVACLILALGRTAPSGKEQK
jgi:putative spermidine/putrescine transport system permease protein